MLTPPALARLGRHLRRAVRTAWPGPELRRILAAREIPVFIYHDVDAQGFGADLEFLRENGYRTVGLDEFARGSGRGEGERRVLLSFDDGRCSFWDVAFPLLQHYDARAALFVPTLWMRGARSRGANAAPHEQRRFMSWGQLRSCAQSGRVDVQSHGHRHTLVFTDSTLVGFASPALLARCELFDWPLRRERGRDVNGRPALGTPIYRAQPLLSVRRRWVEPDEVGAACRALVACEGGASFFARTGARSRLRAEHERACRGAAPLARGDPGALAALKRAEFRRSRELFEQELGEPPRFFAFPWTLGTPSSLEHASASGIRMVFGVAMDGARARALDGWPLPVRTRVRGDFLRLLPGRGRLRWSDVLRSRLGRLRGAHLAH